LRIPWGEPFYGSWTTVVNDELNNVRFFQILLVRYARIPHHFLCLTKRGHEPMYSPTDKLYGNSLKRLLIRRCFAEWIIGMDQLQKQA